MKHSVQLYSVREDLSRGAAATLTRLREIGLDSVEPFNLSGAVDDLEQPLRDLGLTAPSAHASLLDPADTQASLDAALRLGTTYLIHPHTAPERWGDEASIRGVAEQLNAAADLTRPHGVRVGYHNHAHECVPAFGGRTGLQVLADHLAEDVVLEVDVFWSAVGGADTVALLEDLGDRVRLLHLKDGAVAPTGEQLIGADTEDQRPLGTGDVPLDAILAAAAACEIGVIEFDAYAGDLFEGIAASYQWLQGRSA